MEKRYFYYLFAINLVANIGLFVPAILYTHRFEGALLSILLAIPLGTGLLGLYIYFSSKLPMDTLPVLLDRFAPVWLKWGGKLFVVVLWYWVGIISLFSIVKITQLFLNPNMSEYVILFLFLLLVVYASCLSSKSILISLEVLFAVNLPIIILFLYKLLAEGDLEWIGAVEITTYLFKWPTFDSIAAASFIFSGYTNMVVFQRVFAERPGFKWFFLIPLMGAISLVIGYYGPILYHGTIGVGYYVYPWIVTADSVRMEFFIVERMIFVFLFIFTSISLFSIIVHWHVSLSAVQSLFAGFSWGEARWLPGTIGFLFAMMALILYGNLNEGSLLEQSRLFMLVRLPAEFILIGVMTYLVFRRRRLVRDDTTS